MLVYKIFRCLVAKAGKNTVAKCKEARVKTTCTVRIWQRQKFKGFCPNTSLFNTFSFSGSKSSTKALFLSELILSELEYQTLVKRINGVCRNQTLDFRAPVND